MVIGVCVAVGAGLGVYVIVAVGCGVPALAAGQHSRPALWRAAKITLSSVQPPTTTTMGMISRTQAAPGLCSSLGVLGWCGLGGVDSLDPVCDLRRAIKHEPFRSDGAALPL